MNRLYYFENQEYPIVKLKKDEIKNPLSKSLPNIDDLENSPNSIIVNYERPIPMITINTENITSKSLKTKRKFELIKYLCYKICVSKRNSQFFDSLRLFLIFLTLFHYTFCL